MELESILAPEKFMERTPAERRRLILEFLRENPGKHYQGTWGSLGGSEFKRPTAELSCGTTACVAGWAAIFAGHEPVVSQEPYAGRFFFDRVRLSDGGQTSVEGAAREVLDLDAEQASFLFHQDNTRDDIETMLENLESGQRIEMDTHHDDSEDDDGRCDCGECDTEV